MKVAVVGAGIAGLSCAFRLSQAGVDVTLYEAAPRFGGHSHTVDVELDGQRFGVDTGFLVFNERTYPHLIALFAELEVETAPSDMSFSVRLARPDSGGAPLEWAGSSLDTVFAQRRNLLAPQFLSMLADILRFNRQASALARQSAAMPALTLGQFLAAHRYGARFRDAYLLPMAACIWSCPSDQMLAFPLATFVRFCHNHGLLQVSGRPQWRTVRGGSRRYVERMLAAIPSRRAGAPVVAVERDARGGPRSVRVASAGAVDSFDHVVMACHSDQSLALLSDVRTDERALLGAVHYQANHAVLHTDASCLPSARRAWAAWNYQSTGAAEPQVCVHYLINKLQPLPCTTPVIVSLNPIDPPDPALVLGRYDYAHPVFDAAAIAAQARLPELQGRQNTWFAGAWTGYGFHEDGLKSGLAVAAALAARAAGGGHAAA